MKNDWHSSIVTYHWPLLVSDIFFVERNKYIAHRPFVFFSLCDHSMDKKIEQTSDTSLFSWQSETKNATLWMWYQIARLFFRGRNSIQTFIHGKKRFVFASVIASLHSTIKNRIRTMERHNPNEIQNRLIKSVRQFSIFIFSLFYSSYYYRTRFEKSRRIFEMK